MNILLIGSGGREHALAWKLSQSSKCTKLYCAPGNAGIAQNAECALLDVSDHQQVLDFINEHHIEFVVIGPEQPLVEGLADKINVPCFGPTKMAAQLEGSKGFMKDLCAKYNIPTAAYGRFTDVSEAKEFVEQNGAPIVVKADGLAGGKGVIICETNEQAYDAIDDMLSGNKFNAAGHEIVIEEFLEGEELSFFALSDGKTVLPLTGAQDHKRVFDGDQGPNTGGMGAYSPPPILTSDIEQKVMEQVVKPTIDGMAAEGYPFKGVLFAGLMIKDGQIKLLEHNIRFGDPECQVLMMRLKTDLVDLLYASATETLDQFENKVEWHDMAALTVVMAAEGYPESYAKSTEIKNVEIAELPGDIKIFHAGTKEEDGKLVNFGGRVLNVTAIGQDIATAQEKAYDACAKVDWPEGFYRTDIGWRAL